MITEKDMQAAVDRIARTGDGELLFRWLQLKLMEIVYSVDPSTLLVQSGERIFASRLIAAMRIGIDESAGRTSSDGKPSERPIVIGRREPIPTKRTTARDRIAAELNAPIDTD